MIATEGKQSMYLNEWSLCCGLIVLKIGCQDWSVCNSRPQVSCIKLPITLKRLWARPTDKRMCMMSHKKTRYSSTTYGTAITSFLVTRWQRVKCEDMSETLPWEDWRRKILEW